MICRYCFACSVSWTIDTMTGWQIRMTMLPSTEVRKVSRSRRLASRSARAMSPAPIVLPRMIAVPFAMPKPSTEARLRIIETIEFAATMSSPRWPMMTAYIEKARPQTNSFCTILSGACLPQICRFLPEFAQHGVWDFGLCPARMQADKKKVFYTAAISAYNLKGDGK